MSAFEPREWGNRYWTVTEPFQVLVPLHTVESNTYVGRGQALGQVYLPVTLPVGAFIWDVHGGVYIEHDGLVVTARIKLPPHPFGRGGMPPRWPRDKVKPANQRKMNRTSPAASPVLTFDEARALGATPADNMIDWLLEPKPEPAMVVVEQNETNVTIVIDGRPRIGVWFESTDECGDPTVVLWSDDDGGANDQVLTIKTRKIDWTKSPDHLLAEIVNNQRGRPA